MFPNYECDKSSTSHVYFLSAFVQYLHGGLFETGRLCEDLWEFILFFVSILFLLISISLEPFEPNMIFSPFCVYTF